MERRLSLKQSPDTPSSRQEGIALLVVMVVFVVLYLVIYQLHFSTKMEENIAQARYGEGESFVACYSAGLFVITHLIEDLRNDLGGEMEGQIAPGLAGALGSGELPAGNRKVEPKAKDRAKTGAKTGVGGTFSDLGKGGSDGAGKKVHDSLYENIFNDNQQQVGDISVKISIVDGERMFDLNQLFDYVHVRGEEVADGDAAVSEEDLASAVTGAKDGKEASDRLVGKVSENIARKRAERRGKTSGTAPKDEGISRVSDLDTAKLADVAYGDYESPEFESPDLVRVEATKKMVERAILMMFSINENRYGYRYQRSRRYDAGLMAQLIVDYVLERRSGIFQNRIYLVTELLNLCSPGGEGPGDITPEIFYGPFPRLAGDEDYPAGDGFILKRDEFGDIVPEYLHGDDFAVDKEEEKRRIAFLEETLGRFADFGGNGLSRLAGNALTRGMKDLPVDTDLNGEDYVVDVPKPIGLKDLFTTYSTGKININTASEPVLAGLLQSISDEEADFVASSIRSWRQRFPPEEEETGIDDVDSNEDRAGSKTRKGRSKSSSRSSELGQGLAPEEEDLSRRSSYQELELNYFTDLEAELDLVDGTDEGREDLLRKDQGIEKVSEEDDTLYRKVVNDLKKVTVYSSTYFNAELKAKPREGKSVKTGFLTVRRDLKRMIVDVVMWKNLQK